MTATLDAPLDGRAHGEDLPRCLASSSSNLRSDVVVLHSDASQWLIDLEQRRFQHLEPANGPPLRARIRRPTVAACPDIATAPSTPSPASVSTLP
jgi:hypothetical protein